MITLRCKYLIPKMLWGILFIAVGMAKLWTLPNTNETIKNIGDVVCWGVFLIVLAAEFYIEKKKVEPMDELAVLNRLKARSIIYQGLFVLIVLYLLFGASFHFTINSGKAFLVLGIFQILEFVFFEVYERKGLESFE